MASMDEAWICEKLQNLRIKMNRAATLQLIRDRLNSTTMGLQEPVTTRLLRAPEIYDCVADNTSQPLDAAIDILAMCMASLTVNQTQNYIADLLERALVHPSAQVRALALKTILRELEQMEGEEEELERQEFMTADLMEHVLRAVRDKETEVGAPAVGILSLILEERLSDSKVQEFLKEMLDDNETVKCRAYELAVNLGKRCSTTLQRVQFIIDDALSELDNDDVLLQVNILEILVGLAAQNHGLVFLERRQVLEVISKRVEQMEEQPLNRLLIPGIMKFFGRIACMQPERIIRHYPHLVACLFQSLSAANSAVLPTAFDTFANVVHKGRGKQLMDECYDGPLKDIFHDFNSHLRNLPTDLKVRAFLALASVFTPNGHVSSDVSAILQKWLSYLAGGPSLLFLMPFYRNPFPDIKIACLKLMEAVCCYPWGVAALKDTAGMLESLLDRKVEFDKEVKYGKFQVIQHLARSTIFDAHTLVQLNNYIREGPYFIEAHMEIAVEGN